MKEQEQKPHFKIVQFPDPVLTTPCKEVPPYDEETKKKAFEMISLMHESGGLGLAAPQVGWPVRLFVVDMKGTDVVFIDPFIVTKSGGTLTEVEGCLSILGLGANVARAKKVEMSYFDLEGREKTVKDFDPDLSRVIQHEYDHLDGVLFFQKVVSAEKKNVMKHIEALREGRIKRV